MKIVDDLKFKSECYFGKIDAKSLLRVLFSDGSSAMVFYRTAQFFRKIKLGFIGYLFLYINKVINGCVIGRNAEFGERFVIMHPQGVIINGAVQGGSNIVIESGVVIGASKNGQPVEVPKFGNHVFIGSGAKVLGGISVGSGVKIGANSVVLRSVPDGATVVGIPGKIVQKNE